MNSEEINVELNPDTIYGYLMTTQGYSEEQDDKRKKPLFFWKAFHFYPFAITNLELFEDIDEEDLDPNEVELAICTEGGDKDSYNVVPMTAQGLQEFVRNHPSFRIMQASDLFEALNIV